ncbi:40S ribosomal protein S9 [Ascosphaera apis ARSEF 7405]|uniref:Small ribosomal subunit protein uS9m n=1 Tax=Ascosphaera apis ARSEF 7405 TaxID=392613 RepID=A0A167VZV3_9EURO|nr:40S ribosomal protein S9 [Ascosphaera apis ARSEF 7405]
MLWHRPGALLARAVRSVHWEPQLSALRPIIHTHTHVHARQSNRTFTTSPPSAATAEPAIPITAAPPIDFSDPNAIPARILPASPSYFTGSPKFIDHFLKLDLLRARYAALPTVDPSEAPKTTWLKIGALRDAVNEMVPQAKYKRLQKILARLNLIRPDLMPLEVKETLDFFTQKTAAVKDNRVISVPDDKGRAFGVGRRKTSSARVWLVEGDGQVLVNGKPLTEVFPRVHTREEALWPLHSTKRIDKYNVWALTRGGGVTGQAEAMIVALAKALIVHEPALKPVLRRAGCVTTDPRQVERKKPGHLKARKKPAWVKR